ncbi:hypothetical protein EDC01DRAFT_747575 [Geopyxis carbonaria]|nr:hypothetical protein EDC01DRAFT_747575 [Geopyxis carbonaria]
MSSNNRQRRTPVPYRSAPIQLLCYDLYLFTKLTVIHLKNIFFPLAPSLRNAEISLTAANIIPAALHTVLFFLCIVSVALIPAWFILPGAAWLLCLLAAYLLAWLLSVALNAGIHSGHPIHAAAPADAAPADEREHWLFVNGICSGRSWTAAAVDELSLQFARPVTGIHNRTFGILLDLLQCASQRSLGLYTSCIRDTYQHLHDALTAHIDDDDDDSSNDAWRYDKIVVLAHSQGALVVSLAIDMLLADLPRDTLAGRIEVYTFGGAANHFNNPGGVLRVVEHYVNALDPVATIGVSMYSAAGASRAAADAAVVGKKGPATATGGAGGGTGAKGVQVQKTKAQKRENQFAGTVFTRKGHGHLLVMHYLQHLRDESENGFTSEGGEKSLLRRYLGGGRGT